MRWTYTAVGSGIPPTRIAGEAICIGRAAHYFEDGAIIYTLEGSHRARKGDFIIRGVEGELYPCKYDIFWKTYEIALLENEE